MTENEAIDVILKEHSSFTNPMSKAYVMACKALEEIQNYRALGALEEIQTIFDECTEYEAIGTIEEFKALKEDKNFLEFLYNHIPPNEMEQYLSMYHIKEKIAVNGYADQSGLMSAT